MSIKNGERKIAVGLAKYVLRSGRGCGLLSHILDVGKDMLEATVYLFALKGLLGIQLPPAIIPVIVIAKKSFEYFIGWFDEKVGFWKIEADYSSREINPYNAEVLDRIKEIERCVKK